MKKGYRHGDVILTSGISIPVGAKKIPKRPLAYGEVTGHSHQVSEGEFDLYEKDGVLFMRVLSDDAKLSHEEHSTIALPKGDYKVRIQREYEPEGWREVRD